MKDLPTQEYILFDIDSSSVGVLLFLHVFDEKKKKHFYEKVFSQRKNIYFHKNAGFSHFFSQTLKAFEELNEQVLHFTHGDIGDIFIQLGAPWSISQKRTLHFEKEKPFVFDEEIKKTILKKEMEYVLHHTRDFYEHKDLTILDRKVLSTTLDGYKVKNPFGKKVKSVDLESYITVFSQEVKEKFSHIVEKNFHREAKFISYQIMLPSLIRKILPYEKNILYINLQKELTEISLFSEGKLKKIGTIPLGTRFILESIGESLNVSLSKIRSLLVLSLEGKIHDDFIRKNDVFMEKAFIIWFKEFYDFLGEIGKEYIIPNTFLLKSSDDLANIFGNELLKKDELELLFSAKKKLSLVYFKNILKDIPCSIDFSNDEKFKSTFLSLLERNIILKKE